jgi:hypothetical protein
MRFATFVTTTTRLLNLDNQRPIMALLVDGCFTRNALRNFLKSFETHRCTKFVAHMERASLSATGVLIVLRLPARFVLNATRYIPSRMFKRAKMRCMGCSLIEKIVKVLSLVHKKGHVTIGVT